MIMFNKLYRLFIAYTEKHGKGTICAIGGGNWFIELDHITSIKKAG